MNLFNIKENPHGLLLLAAIALLLANVFPALGNIDLRDKTMFSFPLAIMVWMIPLLLISFWLLYLLTKRFLYSMTITRIHVLITVAATILIVTVLYIGINPSEHTIASLELIGDAMRMLTIIFVCAQLAYLANILLGLLIDKKNNP